TAQLGAQVARGPGYGVQAAVGEPKKKPHRRSMALMFVFPETCTGIVMSSRLACWLLISAEMFALACSRFTSIAWSARPSTMAAAAPLAIFGFFAVGFTVGSSSGIRGAPSHSVDSNSSAML